MIYEKKVGFKFVITKNIIGASLLACEKYSFRNGFRRGQRPCFPRRKTAYEEKGIRKLSESKSKSSEPEKENRKGVFLYYDFVHALQPLDDELFGRILRGMAEYSEKGVFPEFDDVCLIALFNLMRSWDDIDRGRYEKILEKRREAGKKGAAARWGAREGAAG